MRQKLRNGVHEITNTDYHSSDGISRSALWEFKRSPWHYWIKYLNPDAVPEKPNSALKLGEILHTLVLEPQEFDKRYIIDPEKFPLPRVGLLKDIGREEFERQKKAREAALEMEKLFLDKLLKETENKEIVPREIYQEAKAMADSVLSNQTARDLFREVKIENSIYFEDKGTGIQCKARMDAWTGGLITDLKTAKDASYKAFQSSAFSYGYFLQAAMMKAALASVGIELEKFVFYIVEKSPGYPTTYYLLDEEAIDFGTKQFNILMQKLAYCLEKDKWGFYEPQILSIPAYAKYEEMTDE